jgi:hypothetical protein
VEAEAFVGAGGVEAAGAPAAGAEAQAGRRMRIKAKSRNFLIITVIMRLIGQVFFEWIDYIRNGMVTKPGSLPGPAQSVTVNYRPKNLYCESCVVPKVPLDFIYIKY